MADQELCCRKNQRALKLSTLVLVDTLVKNYSSGLNPELLAPVLAELPPLVSKSGRDLTTSPVAL